MIGLSVLGQNEDQNLQIEIQKLQIAFAIPVRPTRSNIPLKLLKFKAFAHCVNNTTK